MEGTLFFLTTVVMIMFATTCGNTQQCDSVTKASGDVNFCMDGSFTGQTIYIESGAPIYESTNTSCFCDLEIHGNNHTIMVSYYTPPNNYPCGVKLQIMQQDEEFTCTSTSRKVHLHNRVSQLLYSKTAFELVPDVDTNDNRMCLNISMASEPTSNMSIRCRSEKVPGSNLTDTTEGYYNHEGTTTSSLDSKTDSNKVIIATAAGGGGACLLIVCTVIVIRFCRKRKLDIHQTRKHTYVNTGADLEVTHNVVYNMEFLDEKKQPAIIPDSDEMYNSAEHDAQHQANKSTTPIKNMNINDYEDVEGSNTVRFEETTDRQNEKHNISGHIHILNKDPSNNILGREKNADPQIEFDTPVQEKNSNSNTTYSAVNKTNSLDPDRPKQFQVGESGDTYALVNK